MLLLLKLELVAMMAYETRLTTMPEQEDLGLRTSNVNVASFQRAKYANFRKCSKKFGLY